MAAASRVARLSLVGVLAAVLVTSLAVTGCKRRSETPQPTTPAQGSTQPTTTPSTPATQPAEATPTTPPSGILPAVKKSGPVHTPPVGSAERQALADAARKRLKTQSRFIINQMKSDGAWAVAQLTPKDGGATRFVAFRNEVGRGWVAFWDAPKSQAGPKAVLAADDRVPDEVLGAIDWRGVSTTQPAKPPSGQPSEAEAVAAAKRLIQQAYPDLKLTEAELKGLTQDSKGQWWAWTVVRSPGLDPLTVFTYRAGATWKLHDYGTGIGQSDLPSSVKFDGLHD